MSTRLLIKRYGDAPGARPLDELAFDDPIITIGSDPSTSVCLPGAGVAAEQAIVLDEGGQLLLINRADGTTLNDEPLAREGRRPLADGDRLRVGGYVIIFQLAGGATAGARTGANVNTSPLPPPQRRAADQPPPLPLPSAPAPPNRGSRGERDFASILDSLRTEEDSFYFLVEGGTQNNRRVPIGGAELPLGWDETGQHVAFDASEVAAPRGVVRKDWSGVVVQAESAGLVAVNGEPVEGSRRLRSGDRLYLTPTATTAAQSQSILVFHEPASLAVLDSLLPQKMPPPVAPQSPAEMAASLAQGPAGDGVGSDVAAQTPATALERASIPLPPTPAAPRRIFGYFTSAEVLIMIVGTLALAAVVFLFLEYW